MDSSVQRHRNPPELGSSVQRQQLGLDSSEQRHRNPPELGSSVQRQQLVAGSSAKHSLADSLVQDPKPQQDVQPASSVVDSPAPPR